MKGSATSKVLLTLVLAGCAGTGSQTRQTAAEESAESAAVARQFLGDRNGGAWPVGYDWLTVGRVYQVMGPAPEPDVLVAVVARGLPAVRLTGDEAALKSFLAMQFDGRLPGVGALNGIAYLVKDAVVGRGGTIATPEFFESQQRHGLDEWLKGRERDPAEFKRLCSGILRSLDKNEWVLQFNVINGWGGVDVVRASGTASPLTLARVTVDVVKARGEFRYPLEGRDHLGRGAVQLAVAALVGSSTLGASGQTALLPRGRDSLQLGVTRRKPFTSRETRTLSSLRAPSRARR
jgi:hypothetical protein